LFTIKGNLVFMSNLYHKVAFAFACTALSCTLGANKEAKAATFTLYPTPLFFLDGYENGEAYGGLNSEYESPATFSVARGFNGEERRAFYEFDIGNLSLATNTVIRSAILNTPIWEFQPNYRRFYLSLFGYVGNRRFDISDFNAGVGVGLEDAYDPIPDPERPRVQINFDVTYFVNERVSNRDDFAGFSIRLDNSNFNGLDLNYGYALLRGYYDVPPTLIIETEPVPEPTTLFGSALALGVGGWLKRKKSSQQNKTTSQH
jgi:hypothetical protein